MGEKNLETILSIHGSRGSTPVSGIEHIGYGGNTSSYVIKTPENSLIFIDAGSGILNACKEIKDDSTNVYLFFSHMHLDHVIGLPVSSLPFAKQKVSVIGPKDTAEKIKQYYNDMKMPSLDLENLSSLGNGKELQIDSSTLVIAMEGNHKGLGKVLGYRFKTGNNIITYFTDCEFDYLTNNIPLENAEQFKQKYIDFVKDSDILIADAQYTKDEYFNNSPDVRGFGHAYVEQVIDLAEQANVKYLIITHHSPNKNDAQLAKREYNAKAYAKENGYRVQIDFAKENSQYFLGGETSSGESIKRVHCQVI